MSRITSFQKLASQMQKITWVTMGSVYGENLTESKSKPRKKATVGNAEWVIGQQYTIKLSRGSKSLIRFRNDVLASEEEDEEDHHLEEGHVENVFSHLA